MMMRLSEAALATDGDVIGADVTFDAVTTDSRALQPGDLFVALRGERFDGHDFVPDCLARGAAAAMVAKDWQTGDASPVLAVDDTRLALGRLAAHWRAQFALPVAAVTGSNGKTTVKEMLAAILAAQAGRAEAVLATQGNLNNDIGLPLTLFKLRASHRYAVLEMGMNHPGEISYLTRLARPDVALVNNALPAHLEGLGSVEAVAHAKGEIFEGLASHGTAIINADDTYAPLWKSLAAPHRIVTFGLEGADVSADYRLQPEGSDMTLHTPAGDVAVRLPVPGLHNIRNALAATAAALAMGANIAAVSAGLRGYTGVKGRLQRKAGIQGCTVIDDSYNANPASVRAAIDVLAALPGKRILVLGDMGELGEKAAEMHREIGAYAQAAKLDGLWLLGELSRETANGFGPEARHCASPEALAQALQQHMAANTTVLVKGSRFMRMERVVELLTKTKEKGGEHAA